MILLPKSLKYAVYCLWIHSYVIKCKNMLGKDKYQMQGDSFICRRGDEGEKGMELAGVHRKFQL